MACPTCRCRGSDRGVPLYLCYEARYSGRFPAERHPARRPSLIVYPLPFRHSNAVRLQFPDRIGVWDRRLQALLWISGARCVLARPTVPQVVPAVRVAVSRLKPRPARGARGSHEQPWSTQPCYKQTFVSSLSPALCDVDNSKDTSPTEGTSNRLLRAGFQ